MLRGDEGRRFYIRVIAGTSDVLSVDSQASHLTVRKPACYRRQDGEKAVAITLLLRRQANFVHPGRACRHASIANEKITADHESKVYG
ncbi:MAG: hypothetical protein A2176_03985 [Spirochaetes bacterium RBG_13_51_14]|nr:MAG: hypothetical protein A2176_03985 [Spirochaetes bacterium RBG_13_51_14]